LFKNKSRPGRIVFWAGPFGFHLKIAQLGLNSVRFDFYLFPARLN
jgi:hypothetical protein